MSEKDPITISKYPSEWFYDAASKIVEFVVDGFHDNRANGAKSRDATIAIFSGNLKAVDTHLHIKP